MWQSSQVYHLRGDPGRSIAPVVESYFDMRKLLIPVVQTLLHLHRQLLLHHLIHMLHAAVSYGMVGAAGEGSDFHRFAHRTKKFRKKTAYCYKKFGPGVGPLIGTKSFPRMLEGPTGGEMYGTTSLDEGLNRQKSERSSNRRIGPERPQGIQISGRQKFLMQRSLMWGHLEIQQELPVQGYLVCRCRPRPTLTT